MHEVGADTSVIDDFIIQLRRKRDLRSALDCCRAPASAREFVNATFDVIHSGDLHRIAACFTFGREDVVPDMFRSIVMEMRRRYAAQLDRFIYYLDRHIALDTDAHRPMAFEMISAICGDSDVKWRQVEETVLSTIWSRIKLWDGVLATVGENRAADPVLMSARAFPYVRPG